MAGDLWYDEEGGRWFVVPDECAAESGTLQVRDLHGDTRTLDPIQSLQWQVDEAEGRALLEAGVRDQAEQVQGVIQNVVHALGGVTPDLDDPDQASDAVAAAFKGLLGALGGALSEDPAIQARAKAKLGGLAAQFATDEAHREKLEQMGHEAKTFMQRAVQDLD